MDIEITKQKKPKKISTKVKITPPAFPGGDSAWVRFLEESLNKSIPYKNGAKAGTYTVSVRLLIEKDGRIADIRCIKDPGFGMYEPVRNAILRTVLKGPPWTPNNNNSKVRQFHTSAIIFPPSSIKYKMDSVRGLVPFPSNDLLPPEFTSYSSRNEYYAESDSLSTPTFYRGHVFFLTLRSNCTFIYETFYKPYSYARIEFLIGKYKISGDTILLTYESLLPGSAGKVYISPTITVSWQLPDKPTYLLLNTKGFSEPFEQRLKKTTSYAQIEGAQFELESRKCWSQ